MRTTSSRRAFQGHETERAESTSDVNQSTSLLDLMEVLKRQRSADKEDLR